MFRICSGFVVQLVVQQIHNKSNMANTAPFRRILFATVDLCAKVEASTFNCSISSRNRDVPKFKRAHVTLNDHTPFEVPILKRLSPPVPEIERYRIGSQHLQKVCLWSLRPQITRNDIQ